MCSKRKVLDFSRRTWDLGSAFNQLPKIFLPINPEKPCCRFYCPRANLQAAAVAPLALAPHPGTAGTCVAPPPAGSQRTSAIPFHPRAPTRGSHTMSTSEMLSRLSTCTSTPTGMAGPAEGQRQLVKVHSSLALDPEAAEPPSPRELSGAGVKWWFESHEGSLAASWLWGAQAFSMRAGAVSTLGAFRGPKWVFNPCLLHEWMTISLLPTSQGCLCRIKELMLLQCWSGDPGDLSSCDI